MTLARILVVEDEGIVARDLMGTLADLGYSVLGAVATGESAVDQARTLKPDLVLMDVRLAGHIDGVQATQQIHQERDVPVIFLTAHSDDETLRRAKALGPQGYLVKPFKAVELRCAIEIALHRHEINARLKVREQWLSTMLKSIGDGVIATDPEQFVRLMNPVAEALTGWTTEEAYGRALGEIMNLVDEKSQAPLGSPVQRAVERRIVINLQDDAVLVARNGERTPIADSAAPIVSESGEVLGGVMVFRDVSETRQIQNEVRRLNEELESRVRARVAQLEVANKELEAFSYSVAHDLRDPLSGIEGLSELLIVRHAANLGIEGASHLQRLREAAQRTRSIVDDLLRLAHLSSSEIRRVRVDASSQVRSIVGDLRSMHPLRDVQLVVQDGVWLDADEAFLRAALVNLLGNAWKFSSKVPLARIEFGSCLLDGRLTLFVRDNGAGFDMTRAAKLFGAFQRLHRATDFPGTGVGLATVQRIVARHNGRIWAESEVGSGATFWFQL